MAIASMTGFARAAGVTGSVQWAWEAKSVNGRGLDIRLRLPPGQDALGEEARQVLSKALSRGQCQVALTFSRSASAPRIRLNEAALQALVSTLARLDLPDGIAPASLDGLLQVRGVVEVEEEGTDEAAGTALAGALRAALPALAADLRAGRLTEGAALAEILRGQLDAMEGAVAAAESHPGRRPEAVQARLAAQIAPLLDAAGTGALDLGRLHQEAALLATRADIREELDRLSAHIASARTLLAEGGAVGRRLDFLAQELGRESNTLCAKAIDVELSRIGLDLKAVVEQFREQVQNVE